MHVSENGTHSANAAETLVISSNLAYPETTDYYNVITLNHHQNHHHHSILHDHHSDNHRRLSHIHNQNAYHDNQYNHGIHSNVDQSNSNELSLFQDQTSTIENDHSMQRQNTEHQLNHQHAHQDQLLTHHLPCSQESQHQPEADSREKPSETQFVDDIMIAGASVDQDSSDLDRTDANKEVSPPPSDNNVLKPSTAANFANISPSEACNIETSDNSGLDPSKTSPQSPPLCNPEYKSHNGGVATSVKDGLVQPYCPISSELDDELVDDDEDEAEEDEEVEEDEEEDDDDDEDVEEDDDDEEEDDDDEDDDDDDQSESEEDIVDPGQHCQPIHQATEDIHEELNEHDESRESLNDILDGERMLEVTRKLVRNTERDPDRDLRKQVLLKTAIKKLPHFMEYNRYSDTLDRGFHSHMSPQAYYEHHDPQQKFYHTVQPNAIQMSTTSLRMLDLNDDHDPELGTVESENSDPNLGYNTRPSLDQHEYASQQPYDRYHQRTQDINHYEMGTPMISRHNSLDNLYQPINGNDIKDGDERIPIAFQIACEIYDFTCAPDDNERKLLDNLTNSYYSGPTKEQRLNDDSCGEDGTETRDHEGSGTSSSSHSSEESANSIVSHSTESNEVIGESLLETSLNSSSDFYHSSHDSGVALFSPRSNKRSSSSIGLDDEMEVDHLTELSTRGSSIGSNNQYKKLRKREIIE